LRIICQKSILQLVVGIKGPPRQSRTAAAQGEPEFGLAKWAQTFGRAKNNNLHIGSVREYDQFPDRFS
jgi:hypothetical protein